MAPPSPTIAPGSVQSIMISELDTVSRRRSSVDPILSSLMSLESFGSAEDLSNSANESGATCNTPLSVDCNADEDSGEPVSSRLQFKLNRERVPLNTLIRCHDELPQSSALSSVSSVCAFSSGRPPLRRRPTPDIDVLLQNCRDLTSYASYGRSNRCSPRLSSVEVSEVLEEVTDSMATIMNVIKEEASDDDDDRGLVVSNLPVDEDDDGQTVARLPQNRLAAGDGRNVVPVESKSPTLTNSRLFPSKPTMSGTSGSKNNLSCSMLIRPRSADDILSSDRSISPALSPLPRSQSALPQKKRKPKSYKSCPECDKLFLCESKLVRHMRTHTGDKPFVCFCGQSFSQNCSLKVHSRRHALDAIKNGEPESGTINGFSISVLLEEANRAKANAAKANAASPRSVSPRTPKSVSPKCSKSASTGAVGRFPSARWARAAKASPAGSPVRRTASLAGTTRGTMVSSLTRRQLSLPDIPTVPTFELQTTPKGSRYGQSSIVTLDSMFSECNSTPMDLSPMSPTLSS